MKTTLEKLMEIQRNKTKYYDSNMDKVFSDIIEDTGLNRDEIIDIINSVWGNLKEFISKPSINNSDGPFNNIYVVGFGKFLHSPDKVRHYKINLKKKKDGQSI